MDTHTNKEDRSLRRARLVEAFRSIPTANVCDAMAQLGLGCGAVHGLAPISVQQPRAVGFAFTIRQAPRHHAAQEANLATHARVIDEVLAPHDMLVIDVGGRLDICTGGALLALRAQVRGAAGFVVNGCLRDVREIAKSGFPVHLVGSSPVKSSVALQTVGINEPVDVGGVHIRAGDLVMTDDTGIVVVAIERAWDVLERAQQIEAREAIVMQLLKGGMPFAEAMQEGARRALGHA